VRQKGIDGENFAVNFLKKKGYKIVGRNFHSRFGEIDIIAVDKGAVVFIEVKLRSSNAFGSPLESITKKKLYKLKKTALYYLTINNLGQRPYRFDAIEIKTGGGLVSSINQEENITL